MKVSITLPTLFPELLKQALEAIYENTQMVVDDYEIVVVSPFPVQAPRVVWVREEKPRGNIMAHREAYERSTGDYIVSLVDDVAVKKNWLGNALAFYLEREKKYFPYACGIHAAGGDMGTCFGIYYPYLPFLSRKSMEAIGGYYSTDYISCGGDPDLGMRVWHAGGRCEVCLESHVRGVPGRDKLPESEHRSTTRMADTQTFIRKWKPVFGAGWSTEHLRDYNLDVPGVFVPSLMKDYSIYRNDVKFRDIVLECYKRLPLRDYMKCN